MIKVHHGELKTNEIYQIKYKLTERSGERFAQLVFLDRAGEVTRWSGRPGIGNLTFNPNQVISYHKLEERDVKVTYFNKKQPV